MRLPYPHSMVKIQAVYPAFRRWASWLGHFIGYSFGISRKKASAVSYGTAKTKSSRSGRLGAFCLLEIRKEYYNVLLDAGEGFMAWMWIDVVMWIASFAAYI